MNSVMEMSPAARAYWFSVIACGSLCFVSTLIDPHAWHDTGIRLAVYLVTAILVSGLKIRLPGIFGTLSMSYIVVIAALLNIDLTAGMIVAVISTLGQCVIHAVSRPRWFQVLFSIAGVPIPVLAAWFAIRLPVFAQYDSTGCFAMLAASVVYFAVNTFIVAGIIGLTDGKSVIEVWRNCYLWTSLHYLVGGCIAEVIHLMDRRLGTPALLVAMPPLYLLYRSYSVYLRRMEEQQQHTAQMAQLHLRTIETLALAIDAKDDTTAAHLRRVQTYAKEIGRELKLSPLDMEALEAAALLHDVGKLAVPEYIISKPGKLTPEEFEKMKVHPVVGAELLERVGFPYPVVPIVRSHHEKYDGTGYPDGLMGEDIPIGARILSAIDCLDALASDRQYRKALPLDEAMAYVEAQSGKSFDPKVVAVLRRRVHELEQKAKAASADCVKLSSNIRVERGAAPAAGFAETPPAPLPRPGAAVGMAVSAARREFQLLVDATGELASSLSLDETLALLAARLGRMIEHDAIAIYLVENNTLRPHFVKGESYRLFSSLAIPVGHGLSGWVAENDTPIVNGNPSVEPGYLDDPSKITALRSAISVPLRSEDGLVGVLTLYQLQAEAFTSHDLQLLLAVAPKAGTAIRNALHFESAAAAAQTDELTGLPNARFLVSRMQQEVENAKLRGAPLGIAVMDLDGFTQVNDRCGHVEGNRILQSVADALRRTGTSGEVIGRLGGHEFAIVTPLTGLALQEAVTRMKLAIESLVNDGSCPASITISAGAASFPEDGADAETLLGKADDRLHDARRRGKLQRVA